METLSTILSNSVVPTIVALVTNYLYLKTRFNQELQKLRRQNQEEISKTLVLRSHEIYLKFAKTWGCKFINQTPDKQGAVLSEDDKNEIIQILFEIMYCSHDFNIKKLAQESIQELNKMNSSFEKIESLNRAIIDAPMRDCNLQESKQ